MITIPQRIRIFSKVTIKKPEIISKFDTKKEEQDKKRKEEEERIAFYY